MYNNENLFIERELGPGENILWSAKPICKIKNEGIVMSGFGVFFILVTSFGISNILGSGAPNIMTLFPLIFLCIGIYLLFGPLWVYNTTRDTVYAITNKRALIIIAGKKIKVKAYRLKEDIQALERKENSDGSGNLIFATEISFRNSTDNRSGVNKIKIGFKNINNVYAVQNILQKAINDSAIYTSIVSKWVAWWIPIHLLFLDINEVLVLTLIKYWNDDIKIRGYISEDIPVLVIGVVKGYRRQGIGNILIESIKSVAKENDISKISLYVTKSNVAYHLYTKQNLKIVQDIESSYNMLWEA